MQPKSPSGYNSIPYTVFNLLNEDDFENYIYSNLLDKSNIPQMTIKAKNKIYRSMFEIFQNSIQHSGSNEVYICGQFYPLKAKMALTITDIGNSIQKNVNQFKPEFENYSGKESICWAVEAGNSTKPSTDPGGLGLDLIRTFLKMNHGTIQIISSNGFWEERNGAIFAKDFMYSFEGTIVNIEFNLKDSATYVTPEDISPKNIF